MKRLASPYGAAATPYPLPLASNIAITRVPLIGEGGWIESLDKPVQEETAMPQKPDPVTARSNDKPFPLHPEGQFAARCVDVIDLGEAVINYPGTQPYLAQKVVLIFWTGEKDEESGKVLNLSNEFTLSMGKKANMRKFLEAWRGKSYTDDEAKQGVPIDRLYGAGALLSTEHKPTNSGKTFCAISSIAPLPKQMQGILPKADGIEYERDEWWGKKREQYAKEAEEFRKQSRPKSSKAAEPDFADFPEAQDGDDDLPF